MVAQSRFAIIPEKVLFSNISCRALRVWTVLAFNADKTKRRVWINQSWLAEKLSCCVRQVRYCLSELEKKGFLRKTGQYYQGRYPIFDLISSNEGNIEPNQGQQFADQSGNVLPATKAKVQQIANHVGNLLPRLIIEEQNKEQIKLINSNSFPDKTEEALRDEANLFLVKYGRTWSDLYPCFDGLAGRPTLRDKVYEAISQAKRKRCHNLLEYVERFLHQGAEWICARMTNLQINDLARLGMNTEEFERVRRSDEERRRLYWASKGPQDPPPSTPEDVEAITRSFAILKKCNYGRTGFSQALSHIQTQSTRAA